MAKPGSTIYMAKLECVWKRSAFKNRSDLKTLKNFILKTEKTLDFFHKAFYVKRTLNLWPM